jgi:3-oxoacyl-[acyl-carrier-protein] synthase-3
VSERPKLIGRTGPAGARLLGFGSAQGNRVVTNDDIAASGVDTNDEWIRQRVGIVERRLADPDQSLVDMAVEAGSKALADSGVSPDEIDTVLVATCTMPGNIPNAAAQTADRIGVRSPAAFDLNAACAGFPYSLTVASDMIRGGSANKVLVIGAERFTDWVDWQDRANCIIFADGAGACVVGPSDEPMIAPAVLGSSGDLVDMIGLTENGHIFQEGQSVFRWATTELAPKALEAIRRAGYEPADIKAFVAHQANLRIIEGIAKRLNLPDAIVATDVVESGNTSAASVPLALSKLIERRVVASGDPVLLFGFGGGLTYAGQVVRCP